MLANAKVDEGSEKGLPTSLSCGRYVFIGWFANAITWFRLGDAYRAYSFTEDYKYSFSRAMGTVLAERILDITTVFIMILLASLTLYSGTNRDMLGIFIIIAFMLVSLATLGFIAMKHFGIRIASLLPSRIESSYIRFHHGTMDSLNKMSALLTISFFCWLTEIGRLFFIINALDITGIIFSLIVFVTLANAILTTVPLTPGGIGIVEPGIIGLLALSVPTTDAVSIALLDRSISYMSIVILGGFLFIYQNLSKSKWKYST
jgi:uncharacterized protein (TIRG00374 family)